MNMYSVNSKLNSPNESLVTAIYFFTRLIHKIVAMPAFQLLGFAWTRLAAK